MALRPCGPFVILDGYSDNQGVVTAENPSTIGTLNAPNRALDCPHYEDCLEIAAALDWPTFTCSGCCGEVNQVLLWKSHGAKRRDPVARMLCQNTPSIEVINGSFKGESYLPPTDSPEEPTPPVLPSPFSETHAAHPRRAKI